MGEAGASGLGADASAIGLIEGLIDDLVSLRFKARHASMQQLSAIKLFKKSVKGLNVDVDSATADLCDQLIAATSRSSKDLLEECDLSRDALQTRCGIQISDTKDRSIWKKTPT